MSVDTITLYADYVCPFCYLGRTSLERYRETRSGPLAIEWHPFDLRAGQRDESGEIVGDFGKDEAYYERAHENVQQLAEEYGVEMPDDPILDVDSLLAQRVSLFVATHQPDAWEAFDRALYDALWQDERDIGDRDVLVSVAENVGLDGDVVGEALADDELRADIDERFEAARRRGITGVPTFVYGDHATRGAVPPEHLQRLVEETD